MDDFDRDRHDIDELKKMYDGDGIDQTDEIDKSNFKKVHTFILIILIFSLVVFPLIMIISEYGIGVLSPFRNDANRELFNDAKRTFLGSGEDSEEVKKEDSNSDKSNKWSFLDNFGKDNKENHNNSSGILGITDDDFILEEFEPNPPVLDFDFKDVYLISFIKGDTYVEIDDPIILERLVDSFNAMRYELIENPTLDDYALEIMAYVRIYDNYEGPNSIGGFCILNDNTIYYAVDTYRDYSGNKLDIDYILTLME